uniref:Ig-like domain-containing protein n=1 Tax=Cyprinodon variegatus TaxID=28743 RepID=A0A3Q2D8W6_CYPVA
ILILIQFSQIKMNGIMFTVHSSNFQPGEIITLPCRAAENQPVHVGEWRRTDQASEYVLRYRDEQFDEENQHPSFKNRVHLKDRQMKNGDVSLVLENVTADDEGLYQCLVAQGGKPQLDLLRTIQLVVAPPSAAGESFRLWIKTSSILGKDVTLQCSAAGNQALTVVRWERTDLGQQYVLLFRDDQIDDERQHSFFKNRVALKDREMKGGDVSLVLKNVTTNDTGRYICSVFHKGLDKMETVCIIQLDVASPSSGESASVGCHCAVPQEQCGVRGLAQGPRVAVQGCF